jgi:hypothetical protein
MDIVSSSTEDNSDFFQFINKLTIKKIFIKVSRYTLPDIFN